MTFKELKKQIKEEQKNRAIEIKELKSKRKSVPCGYVGGLNYNSDRYRHMHIAYCQFFNNTPYSMIERECQIKPRKNTIKDYINKWTMEIHEEEADETEAVCDYAA